MESDASFGRWLQRRRRALDLTQDELAQRVGCSLATIRKIETELRRPSRQVAELLADALAIPAKDRPLFLQVARGERRTERLADLAPPPDRPLAGPAPAPPSRLPAPLTPLIGREMELAELAHLLARVECCLLTLVGPGGIGKTRLAIAAAAEQREAFPDGVFFVALAPLNAPEFILPAIAEAVGFTFYGPIEPQAQLVNYLREKALLLVLDTVEHLLDGVALLSEMLQHAPHVKLLITSRERLNLLGEWVVEVQGLPVPPADQMDQVESYSAVRLFVQTAQRVRSGFALSEQNRDDVARVCRLVDGLPLGIELAAAWVYVLSCHEIAEQIQRNIDFLAVSRRDLPDRHRSIRAVFDHSWKLLVDEEQQVLRRLAVFRGGFTREAAETVAGASLSLLSALVGKSLLQRTGTQAARFDLHELIHQYGSEKAHKARELDAIRDRHLEFFLSLAEMAEPYFAGPQTLFWSDRLEQEMDNLRAALAWALERHTERALRLGNALRTIWVRNWVHEGNDWLRKGLRAAELNPTLVSPAVRARALASAASLEESDVQALTWAQESVALARDVGDQRSMALALLIMAGAEWNQGHAAQARTLYEESQRLYQENGDKPGLVDVLIEYGQIERYEGHYERAAEMHTAGLALARDLGRSDLIAMVTIHLGALALRTADFGRAQTLLEEAEQLCRTTRSKRGLAAALVLLGRLAAFRGQYTSATSLLQQSVAIIREVRGIEPVLSYALLGEASYFQGDEPAATHWYETALAFDPQDPYDRAMALLGLGCATRLRGDYARATQLLQESLVWLDAARELWTQTLALYALGQVAQAQGDITTAERHFRESLKIVSQLGDKRGITQCLEGLAVVEVARWQAARAATLFGAAATLREWIGAPLPPVERAGYEKSLAAARAQLDATLFADAWEQGQAKSLDTVVAEILEQTR